MLLMPKSLLKGSFKAWTFLTISVLQFSIYQQCTQQPPELPLPVKPQLDAKKARGMPVRIAWDSTVTYTAARQ